MSSTNDPKATGAQPPRMSSQMQAVMRVLTGQEERTIAQKLADSNRPTWEQYKKDNEDKLNLEGMDQKKMDDYRQQLDAERDTILARGTNHKRDDKKKSKSKKKRRKDDYSDGSESDSSSEDKKRKKHKKKKKKKHRKRHRDDDDSAGDSSRSDSDSEDRKRKRKRKKKKRRADSEEESDGSHYRLSKFFGGSDDGE